MKLIQAIHSNFNLTVNIPVPGGEDLPVEFSFKWNGLKKRAENMLKFRNEEIGSFEYVQTFVAGWGFDEEFNEKNFELLADKCPAALAEINSVYETEIWKEREKN